ncbi:MAG TPA: histidine phosphatase family protein [Patescibacteria group bacterium]|nr:histidine phosphatase family protein [Patescibacteria group bacterium]
MATESDQLTQAMRSLEAAFLIGVEGVCEIWLCRHADCYQDPDYDVNDPALSRLGREQAARLAERVRRAKPAAVYASPYRRAPETARAINGDVRVDPRLIEMQLEMRLDGSMELKEEPAAVIARMRAALADIAREHAGERVVVISHGAAIIATLTDILMLEPGQLRLLPYFTSVSVLRVLGDRAMAGGLTDTSHLE